MCHVSIANNQTEYFLYDNYNIVAIRTYSISTHTLSCTGKNGKTLSYNDIVSGRGTCTNNTNEMCLSSKDYGATSPDDYNIFPNGNLGHSGWWSLQSKSWTPGLSGLAHKFGLKRAGFNIHLGNVSWGCITIKNTKKGEEFFKQLSDMFKKDETNNISVSK